MASEATQPFCQCTLSGQSDRLTDGLGERSTLILYMLTILIDSNVLIMINNSNSINTYKSKHLIVMIQVKQC